MENKHDSSDNPIEADTDIKKILKHDDNKPDKHMETDMPSVKTINDDKIEKDIQNNTVNKDDFMDNIELLMARIVGEEVPEEQTSTDKTADNDNSIIQKIVDNSPLEDEVVSEEHTSLHDNAGKRENLIIEEEIADYMEVEEDFQSEGTESVSSNQSDSPMSVSGNSECEEENFMIDEKTSRNVGNINYCSSGKRQNIEKSENIGKSVSNQQYDISELVSIKKVKDLHRCHLCHYTTPLLKVLRNHVSRRHMGLPCKHCSKRFASKTERDSHSQAEHSSRARKCPYCKYNSICMGKQMRQHIWRAHLESMVDKNRCKHCQETFLSKASIADHIKKEHAMEIQKGNIPNNKKHFKRIALDIKNKRESDRSVHPCPHCKIPLESETLLNNHILIEHSKKTRTCPYCFYRKKCTGKVMRRHITTVHNTSNVALDSNKKTYECKYCPYSDLNTGAVRSHTKMHNLEYVLKCPLCYYMIDNVKLLRIHLEKDHKVSQEHFVCHKCFFQSYSKSEFESHVEILHKVHTCKACGFKTPYVEVFYDHEALHEDKREEKNACSECGYLAGSADNLERHMMQHKQRNRSKKDIDVGMENSNCFDTYEKETNLYPEESNDYQQKYYEEVNRNIERYEEKAHIIKHYAVHEKDGALLYVCNYCDFKGNQYSGIIKHISYHIVELDTMKSDIKNANDSRKESSELNVETKQDEIIHSDQKCLSAINTLSSSQNEHVHCEEINSTLKGKTFGCDLCDFSSAAYTSLILHKEQKHNISNFKCPSCSLQINSGADFISHLKEYPQHTSAILTCPFCQLSMDDKAKMKDHVNKVHVEILQKGLNETIMEKKTEPSHFPFLEGTESSEQIEDAYEVEETEVGKTYTCKHCGFFTGESKLIDLHLQSVHDCQFLRCPSCSKSMPSDLKRFWEHLNEHCPQRCFTSKEEETSNFTHTIEKHLHKSDVESSDYAYCDENTCNEPVEEIRIIFDDSCSEDENWMDCNTLSSVDGDIDVETVKSENIDGDDCTLDEKEDAHCLDDDAEVFEFQEEIPYIKEHNGKAFTKLKKHIQKYKNQEEVADSRVYSKDIKEEAEEDSDSKSMRILRLVVDQCFDCYNIYKNRCTLVYHRKNAHPSKNPHSCTYCVETFKKYIYLKSHYYRVHKVSFHNKEPIFKCTLCDFSSSFLKPMKTHCMDDHNRYLIGFEKNRRKVCY